MPHLFSHVLDRPEPTESLGPASPALLNPVCRPSRLLQELSHGAHARILGVALVEATGSHHSSAMLSDAEKAQVGFWQAEGLSSSQLWRLRVVRVVELPPEEVYALSAHCIRRTGKAAFAAITHGSQTVLRDALRLHPPAICHPPPPHERHERYTVILLVCGHCSASAWIFST